MHSCGGASWTLTLDDSTRHPSESPNPRSFEARIPELLDDAGPPRRLLSQRAPTNARRWSRAPSMVTSVAHRCSRSRRSMSRDRNQPRERLLHELRYPSSVGVEVLRCLRRCVRRWTTCRFRPRGTTNRIARCGRGCSPRTTARRPTRGARCTSVASRRDRRGLRARHRWHARLRHHEPTTSALGAEWTSVVDDARIVGVERTRGGRGVAEQRVDLQPRRRFRGVRELRPLRRVTESLPPCAPRGERSDGEPRGGLGSVVVPCRRHRWVFAPHEHLWSCALRWERAASGRPREHRVVQVARVGEPRADRRRHSSHLVLDERDDRR